LPFTDFITTFDATTAADDPSCNGHSVWYSFTPTRDVPVKADTSGSDYATTLTAAAVCVGVAILLGVLAEFHAFQVTNNRPFWESTRATQAAGSRLDAPAPGTELWHYSDDIVAGRTIERLDVAALGPNAPVPPGVPRLPASGQYDASPALAALLRSTPRDELGDRFPGTLVGTIGNAALSGPDELVAFVGYRPDQLAAVPTAFRVTAIETAPGRQVWSPFFAKAFVVAAIAFVFPILILVGTATRLAAARREERYAALRLAGAAPGQVSVVASVDAAVAALLGTLLGVAIFLAVRPALARAALTNTRYFPDLVTPTVLGYACLLVGVPVAAATAAVLSLRRVRISPLGVSRRATPPPPRARRLVPLLAGIALLAAGLALTTSDSIGAPAYPGLIVVLIGLVVAGPWLTVQAGRLAGRLGRGAPALLAARRLADNPKAAFRTVSGLVLAVFLGTAVAGLMPAANATMATPQSTALSDVLLAGFAASPICGNEVNCTGAAPGAAAEPDAPDDQPVPPGFDGLPAGTGTALLARLRAFAETTVVPIYSLHIEFPRKVTPADTGSRNNSLLGCAALRQLDALGQCPPGAQAIEVDTSGLYSDNPFFSTRPIAGPGLGNVPVRYDVAGLALQSVLVRVDSPATLERVRTLLGGYTRLSSSGAAPRTFGEAVAVRAGVGSTVQRLVFVAVVLTLLVAGCSIAVAVGGGLVERKRPFGLLRLTGTPTGTLRRVVLLEAVLPLAAATLLAAATGYAIALAIVARMAPKGTPLPTLGHVYYLTVGAGLAVSLAVILTTLPLLSRITEPSAVRFE